MTDLFFNRSIITIAINQVLYRSKGAEQFNMFDVINKNINYMRMPFFISLTFTSILSNVNMNKNKDLDNEKRLSKILPYIIISIIPFIWYILLQNHSWHHAFFTYRDLMITNICFNLGIEEFLKNE